MRIVCSKCNTEYDIELPRTAVEGKHRSLKFRCSSCGYIFTTHLDQAEKKPAPPEEVVADKAAAARPTRPSAPAKGMLLKQEGKTYNVRDLGTLQRWIMERRVLADDLVSFGGGVWEKVSERPELESFLELVDKTDGPSELADPTSEGEAAVERTDAGTEQAGEEESDGGEVLGALESDEELDAVEDSAPTEEMDDREVRLRDDLSDVLAPSPSSSPATGPRQSDGVGIPAFPIGASLSGRPDPLAMGPTGVPLGQTSRDQVMDAFPMDEVGADSGPQQVMAPMAPLSPPAPVPAPAAPSLMSAGLSGGASSRAEPVITSPLAAPLSPQVAPLSAGVSPLAGAAPQSPVGAVVAPLGQAQMPVPVPVPMPMSASPTNPGLGPPVGMRKSRDLDWDGDRRAPSQNVNWTVIAVTAIVVIGFLAVVLVLVSRMNGNPTVVPVQTVQAPAVAPPATAPAAVAPATAPAAAPATAPAAAPATPPATAPETAPATAPATPPATTTTQATSAPKASSGGKSNVKKGWAALEAGDYGKARSLCLDATYDNPSNADAQYCVAEAARGQGDMPTARERYCKAKALATDGGMAAELAGILKNLGHTCP